MDLDLTKVPIRNINYEGVVAIPKEYYEKMDILDVQNVHLKFEIYKNMDQDDILHLVCTGNFLLQDARNLEPVSYPFQFEFAEKIDEESEMCGRFLENSQNTLDIMAILWENIVLENPISYTESANIENPEADAGWRVVGEEDEENIDPRLAPLRKLLQEKEE